MEVAEKKNLKVPKLRFREFDGTWEVKKLGDHCNFNQGVQVDIELQSREPKDGYVKFLRIENYTQDSQDFRYIPEELTGRKYITQDEIAVVRYGATAGYIGSGFNGVLANNLFKVIPEEGMFTLPFLHEYLKSHRAFSFFQSEMSGGAMPALSFGIVKALKVPLTSLPEQKKIADFLSAVDARIQQLNRKKELLEKYKKGVMQKLFSQELRFKQADGTSYADWEEKRLGGRTSLLKDGTHGTHIDHPGTGYLLLSAKNIVNGNIQFDSSDREISETDYKQIYKNYHLQKGDVLLSVVGTIGRSCLWTNETNIAFQRSVAFFRFSEDNSQFIYQQFNTVRFQNELKRRQVVSAQPGIYLGDLSKIPLLIPSIEEQQKIADFLSSLDKKIGGVNAQIEKTQQFKKGLLQEMFV